MTLKPIRIGVILDAGMQRQWMLDSLQLALALPNAQLASVVTANTRSRTSMPATLHRVLDGIDRRLRCPRESLFRPVDIVAQLKSPALGISTTTDGDRWSPGNNALLVLQRQDVDVWLCFTQTPPRWPLLPGARIGVWGLEIGDDICAASRWAGANEVSRGCPATAISVVDYSKPERAILCRSYSATRMNSVRQHRLHCLRLGVGLFERLLKRIGIDGTPPVALSADIPVDWPGTAAMSPSFAAVGRLSWRLLSNVLANRWRLLHSRDQWQIAYRFSAIDWLDSPHLRYLVPPKDRFWADPFPVEHEGRFFIFFEELEYREQKGRIVVVEVFENGDPGAPEVVLERAYHLSHPFIFKWRGTYFLVPESAGNRTIELYRCEHFPSRWILHKVLLSDIDAFDGTLCEHNDQWWMFATVAPPGTDGNDELHLYSSATPLGPWVPHDGNPVVTDVRCARPAGPLFMQDGVLYRPSQDSSRGYGHSVQINRVDILNDIEYREAGVRRILPDWRRDVVGVHTLGEAGRLRVIDCLVSRNRWAS